MEMPNPQIPLSIKPPEMETPFQMAGQAMNLAGAFEKRQEQQAAKQDEQTVKDYLAGGGNISTPEGLKQAITDLQGKVSPDITMRLSQAADTSEERRARTQAELMKVEPAQLEWINQQHNFLDTELTNAYETYVRAGGAKGSQAALDDFNKAKEATIAKAQGVVNPMTGQPAFPPQMIQNFRDMNPAQVKSLQTTVEYEKKAVDDARKAKLQEAQIQEAQAKAKNLQAGGSASVSPEVVDYYSRQSLVGDNSWKTGLGRSKTGQAIIAAVESRMPELAKEAGIEPEVAAAQRDVRGGIVAALKDRTKFVAASDQFVSNFQKQSDLVEKYLKPGVAGATPVINRWIQAGRKSVAGDPEVAAFDTAIRGLAREHQRIVTGVTSNAQLHASAQETADQLLNVNMTADQVRATLKVMREEATNARNSGRDEVETLKTQLTNLGRGAGGEKPAEKPAAGKKEPPAIGTVIKGHKFKGGDPSDPKNWELVKG